jgi:TolB-like protein
MLADGLAEELATVLAQNRNLRVVARSSAFEFRGNRDVRSIGRQLDTRFVLEGSFRREGDRLIVLVHLIETAHGYQLLADRFERPSSHAYAIPAEIARRTILALGLQ